MAQQRQAEAEVRSGLRLIWCPASHSISTSLSAMMGWHYLQEVKLPKKQLYRARAHSNPLNDQFFDVPLSPAHVNW